MASLTIRDALTEAASVLRAADVPNPRLDAEVLLAFVMNFSRTDIYINNGDIVSKQKLGQYSTLVGRRAQGEPVAHLTGEKEFMSLGFQVNRDVLIPRPETEIIVEEALAIKPLRVIDVGTGSGAIAVSLAYYLPDCSVTATEISAGALAVARQNAEQHGVSDRITFLQCNLVDSMNTPDFYQYFDMVTANLPYIPSREMYNLPVDVRQYEPSQALDGGGDGLFFYRELGPKALRLMKSGGTALFEIGYDQAGGISSYLTGLGYDKVEIIKDLAGLDRVVKARKSWPPWLGV